MEDPNVFETTLLRSLGSDSQGSTSLIYHEANVIQK